MLCRRYKRVGNAGGGCVGGGGGGGGGSGGDTQLFTLNFLPITISMCRLLSRRISCPASIQPHTSKTLAPACTVISARSD